MADTASPDPVSAREARRPSLPATIPEGRLPSHPVRQQVVYWTRRVIIGSYDYEEDLDNRYLSAFKTEFRRCLCEYIGTFFLVLFVAGIQIVDDRATITGADDINVVGKGILGAFVLVGLIYGFGSVSGAHFNPVVTLAFMLRGVFAPKRVLPYWISQLAGSVTAAAILYALFRTNNLESALGATRPVESNGTAFGAEVLLTMIFLTVILSSTEKAKILGPQAALGVGATFGAVLIFGWNISGASVNPFRSLGPTLVSVRGWGTIWIYIVGPLVGMILACILQRIITPVRETDGDYRQTVKGTGARRKKKAQLGGDLGPEYFPSLRDHIHK